MRQHSDGWNQPAGVRPSAPLLAEVTFCLLRCSTRSRRSTTRPSIHTVCFAPAHQGITCKAGPKQNAHCRSAMTVCTTTRVTSPTAPAQSLASLSAHRPKWPGSGGDGFVMVDQSGFLSQGGSVARRARSPAARRHSTGGPLAGAVDRPSLCSRSSDPRPRASPTTRSMSVSSLRTICYQGPRASVLDENQQTAKLRRRQVE
jgi:hypothetical protein